MARDGLLWRSIGVINSKLGPSASASEAGNQSGHNVTLARPSWHFCHLGISHSDGASDPCALKCPHLPLPSCCPIWMLLWNQKQFDRLCLIWCIVCVCVCVGVFVCICAWLHFHFSLYLSVYLSRCLFLSFSVLTHFFFFFFNRKLKTVKWKTYLPSFPLMSFDSASNATVQCPGAQKAGKGQTVRRLHCPPSCFRPRTMQVVTQRRALSLKQTTINTNGRDRLLLSTEFEASRNDDGCFPLP